LKNIVITNQENVSYLVIINYYVFHVTQQQQVY